MVSIESNWIIWELKMNCRFRAQIIYVNCACAWMWHLSVRLFTFQNKRDIESALTLTHWLSCHDMFSFVGWYMWWVCSDFTVIKLLKCWSLYYFLAMRACRDIIETKCKQCFVYDVNCLQLIHFVIPRQMCLSILRQVKFSLHHILWHCRFYINLY